MPTETEIPTETVTFTSISPNQVLTRRAERHVDNGLGGKEILTEREYFQRMEDKGEEFDRTPWKVEFDNHIFTVDETYKRERGLSESEVQNLLKWLRNHHAFNVNAPSGFYEQGAAPDEPQPTLAHQMKRIAETTAEADVDSLQAVLDLERNTHNRPAILQAAEAALRTFAGGSESEAGAGSNDGASSSTSQR